MELDLLHARISAFLTTEFSASDWTLLKDASRYCITIVKTDYLFLLSSSASHENANQLGISGSAESDVGHQPPWKIEPGSDQRDLNGVDVITKDNRLANIEKSSNNSGSVRHKNDLILRDVKVLLSPLDVECWKESLPNVSNEKSNVDLPAPEPSRYDDDDDEDFLPGRDAAEESYDDAIASSESEEETRPVSKPAKKRSHRRKPGREHRDKKVYPSRFYQKIPGTQTFLCLSPDCGQIFKSAGGCYAHYFRVHKKIEINKRVKDKACHLCTDVFCSKSRLKW